MFKKLKTIMLTVAASLTIAAPVAFVGVASAENANISGNLCTGANLKTEGGSCNKNTGDFNNILATVINIFSLVVGIVAVIMIIIGGFNYITSGGDSGKVSTAKNTILYAIIGLVIVVFAQAIVQFVLTKAK